MKHVKSIVAVVALLSASATAQEAPPASSDTPADQTGWSALPRMQVEAVFAAPLKDTVIQRMRDPIDGTICYVYSPIEVQHSPTTPSGFVGYGNMSIGSISCTASSVFAIPSAPLPLQ